MFVFCFLNLKENFRVELILDGKQVFALNLQQRPGGITNLTIETGLTDKLCDDNNNEPWVWNGYSTNCRALRLFGTVVDDGVLEVNIYQDLLQFLKDPFPCGSRYGKQYEKEYEATNGKLLATKLEKNNDIIQYSTTLALTSCGILGLKGFIKNDGQNTNIQLASKYTSKFLNTTDKIELELKPTSTGDEYILELKYTNEAPTKNPFDSWDKNHITKITTVFDGWFSLTRKIQHAVAVTIPNFVERKLKPRFQPPQYSPPPSYQPIPAPANSEIEYSE